MFDLNYLNKKNNKENFIISFDVGLYGYFSIIKINQTKKIFEVIHSEPLKLELKENFILLKDEKNKSKLIVKNQISFNENLERLKYCINKYNININNTFSTFEQLTTRPFNSNTSSFSLGNSLGVLTSVINCLNINYKLIPPSNWKTFLNVTSDKKTSLKLFSNLLEIKEIIINQKAKEYFKNYKNDDQIESILIAYYFYKNI